MPLWPSIRRPRETKDAQSRRHSAGPMYVYPGMPIQSPLGDLDLDRAVNDAWKRVGWVYRCVDARAKNLAKLRVMVATGREDGAPEIDDHPLSTLLNRRTNPYETARQFRYRFSTLADLSTKGVFVEVILNRRGDPTAAHLLNPKFTFPIADPDRFVSGFEFRHPSGEVNTLDPYEEGNGGVLWYRRPHPTDPYMSSTWIESAGISIDVDHYARLYNRNFMLNDGRPGGMLMVDGGEEGIDDETAAMLQSRVRPGPENAGRISVVEAEGIDYVDFATTPRDAQYVEGRALTKAEILGFAGTPESVFNASGRTYDNADAELEGWWQHELQPEAELISSMWEELTPGGIENDDEVVTYAWDEVQALGRSQREREQRASEDFINGLISVDEYRQITQKDPMDLPGTRVLWLAAGKAPVGEQEDVSAILGQGAPGELPPEEGGGPPGELPPEGGTPPEIGGGGLPPELEAGSDDPVGDIIMGEIEAKYDHPPGEVKDLPKGTDPLAGQRKAQAALVDKYATQLQDEILALFRRQEKVIASRLTGTKARKHTRHWTPKPGAPSSSHETKKLDPEYIVDRRRWIDEVVSAIAGIVKAAFGTAGLSVLRHLGDEDGEFDPDDAKEIVAQTVRIIAEGFDARAGHLQKIVADADEAGNTIEQIAEKVKDAFLSVDTWAEVTSRQVVGAMNAAQQIAAAQSGAVKKRWLATDDERTRLTHQEAEGQVVPIDAKFDVGEGELAFPGDPTGPVGEWINCRCTMLFQTPERDFDAELDEDLAALDALEGKALVHRVGGFAAGFATPSIDFDPDAHPRDHRGRFVDTPDIRLPDGRVGVAVSENPNGTVNVALAAGDVVAAPVGAAAPDLVSPNRVGLQVADGFPPDAKAEITATVSEVMADFPAAPLPKIELGIDEREDAMAMAGGWPTPSITIGHPYLDDADAAKYADDWGGGLSLSGGRGMEGARRRILVHEIGHNLHRQMRFFQTPDAMEAVNALIYESVTLGGLGYADQEVPAEFGIGGYSASRRVRRWEHDTLPKAPDDVSTFQSVYACENANEWFAEAFTDGYLNGDQASESGKRAVAIARHFLGGGSDTSDTGRRGLHPGSTPETGFAPPNGGPFIPYGTEDPDIPGQGTFRDRAGALAVFALDPANNGDIGEQVIAALAAADPAERERLLHGAEKIAFGRPTPDLLNSPSERLRYAEILDRLDQMMPTDTTIVAPNLAPGDARRAAATRWASEAGIADWETTQPWNAARADVEAGNVPGLRYDRDAVRGFTAYWSHDPAGIVVNDTFFDGSPSSLRSLLYHEAGHAIASEMVAGRDVNDVLGDFRAESGRGFVSPFGEGMTPSSTGHGLHHNEPTEILADAYAALAEGTAGYYHGDTVDALFAEVAEVAGRLGFPVGDRAATPREVFDEWRNTETDLWERRPTAVQGSRIKREGRGKYRWYMHAGTRDDGTERNDTGVEGTLAKAKAAADASYARLAPDDLVSPNVPPPVRFADEATVRANEASVRAAETGTEDDHWAAGELHRRANREQARVGNEAAAAEHEVAQAAHEAGQDYTPPPPPEVALPKVGDYVILPKPKGRRARVTAVTDDGKVTAVYGTPKGHWERTFPADQVQITEPPDLVTPSLPPILDFGEGPIPEGTVRLYHYTPLSNLDAIKRDGLLEQYAQGDGGMGAGNEPSAGIWASTQPPEHPAEAARAVVEFWARPDQISDRAESLWRVNAGLDTLEEFQAGTRHVIMKGDVPTDQFVQVHEPWQQAYRNLIETSDDPVTEFASMLNEPDEYPYVPYKIALRRLQAEQGGGMVSPSTYQWHGVLVQVPTDVAERGSDAVNAWMLEHTDAHPDIHPPLRDVPSDTELEMDFESLVSGYTPPKHLGLRPIPIEGIRKGPNGWEGTIPAGEHHLYRNVGNWHELVDALNRGLWRSNGGFSADAIEGRTQFSASFSDVRQWGNSLRDEPHTPIIIEADLAGMPARFAAPSGSPALDQDAGTFLPDTGLGLGIDEPIPLDKITGAWIGEHHYMPDELIDLIAMFREGGINPTETPDEIEQTFHGPRKPRPWEPSRSEQLYEMLRNAGFASYAWDELRDDLHAAKAAEAENQMVSPLPASRDRTSEPHPEAPPSRYDKEQWDPGETAWFEYHCNESPDSSDAPAWYRSHQQVTVLGPAGGDAWEGEWADSTVEERSEAGMPRVYRVRFADGLEWGAWEDELLTDPAGFYRPDPPEPPDLVSPDLAPGELLSDLFDESGAPQVGETFDSFVGPATVTEYGFRVTLNLNGVPTDVEVHAPESTEDRAPGTLRFVDRVAEAGIPTKSSADDKPKPGDLVIFVDAPTGEKRIGTVWDQAPVAGAGHRGSWWVIPNDRREGEPNVLAVAGAGKGRSGPRGVKPGVLFHDPGGATGALSRAGQGSDTYPTRYDGRPLSARDITVIGRIRNGLPLDKIPDSELFAMARQGLIDRPGYSGDWVVVETPRDTFTRVRQVLDRQGTVRGSLYNDLYGALTFADPNDPLTAAVTEALDKVKPTPRMPGQVPWSDSQAVRDAVEAVLPKNPPHLVSASMAPVDVPNVVPESTIGPPVELTPVEKGTLGRKNTGRWRHYTGKDGRRYLIHDGFDWVEATTADNPDKRVGMLTWFPGKIDRNEDGTPDDTYSSTNGGTIHKVGVKAQHQRNGIATAMLQLAREYHPDMEIRHSTILSDEGAAWAMAVPSMAPVVERAPFHPLDHQRDAFGNFEEPPLVQWNGQTGIATGVTGDGTITVLTGDGESQVDVAELTEVSEATFDRTDLLAPKAVLHTPSEQHVPLADAADLWIGGPGTQHEFAEHHLIRSWLRAWAAGRPEPGRLDENGRDTTPQDVWDATRAAAVTLAAALETAEPSDVELYRGLALAPDRVPKVGDEITDLASTWTPDAGVAGEFARADGWGSRTESVVLVTRGARQVPLTPFTRNTSPEVAAADERLLTGRFRVDSVEERDGVTYATVTQIESDVPQPPSSLVSPNVPPGSYERGAEPYFGTDGVGTDTIHDRLGNCYNLSVEALFNGAPAGTHVLFGTIQGDGQPPLGHAWLELPNGDRWEPITHTVYGPDEFEVQFAGIEHERYDRVEAVVQMLAAGHYGPWYETDERGVPVDDPITMEDHAGVRAAAAQNIAAQMVSPRFADPGGVRGAFSVLATALLEAWATLDRDEPEGGEYETLLVLEPKPGAGELPKPLRFQANPRAKLALAANVAPDSLAAEARRGILKLRELITLRDAHTDAEMAAVLREWTGLYEAEKARLRKNRARAEEDMQQAVVTDIAAAQAAIENQDMDLAPTALYGLNAEASVALSEAMALPGSGYVPTAQLVDADGILVTWATVAARLNEGDVVPVHDLTVQDVKIPRGWATKRDGMPMLVGLSVVGDDGGRKDADKRFRQMQDAWAVATRDVPPEQVAMTRGLAWMQQPNKGSTPGPWEGAMATGGDSTITFWRFPPDIHTYRHEMGHNIDTHGGNIERVMAFTRRALDPDYRAAVAGDVKPYLAMATVFRSDDPLEWDRGMLDHPLIYTVPPELGFDDLDPFADRLDPTAGSGPSEYGRANQLEDYAESLAFYLKDRFYGRLGTVTPDEHWGFGSGTYTFRFADLYPARARYFDDLFGDTPAPLSELANARVGHYVRKQGPMSEWTLAQLQNELRLQGIDPFGADGMLMSRQEMLAALYRIPGMPQWLDLDPNVELVAANIAPDRRSAVEEMPKDMQYTHRLSSFGEPFRVAMYQPGAGVDERGSSYFTEPDLVGFVDAYREANGNVNIGYVATRPGFEGERIASDLIAEATKDAPEVDFGEIMHNAAGAIVQRMLDDGRTVHYRGNLVYPPPERTTQ